MHVKFLDVCKDVTKTACKIPQREYLSNGKYKIFDQSQKYIGGYSDLEEGVAVDYPYIVFGDHTRVVKFIEEPCFIGADGVKLLKVVNEEFLPKYIYYAMLAKPVEHQGYSRHFKLVKELYFEKVDKRKQQKIIDELEKIEWCIKLKNEQLADLDELVKSRFVEQFGDPVLNEKGWRTKPLLEMGNCKNGMNFHYDECGVEINCLGVGDFKDLSVIDNTELLPTVSLNEMPSEEYLLKDDDIVFVRSNGNRALVGRSVAVYPGDIPTTFSGFCIRYRKYDDEVTIPYLLRVLKTDSIRSKMTGRGANIQNLNQQILGTLLVPVPPIELQTEFSEFVKQVDKSKVIIQKQIVDLQELLDSKMDEYFS